VLVTKKMYGNIPGMFEEKAVTPYEVKDTHTAPVEFFDVAGA